MGHIYIYICKEPRLDNSRNRTEGNPKSVLQPVDIPNMQPKNESSRPNRCKLRSTAQVSIPTKILRHPLQIRQNSS